MRGEGKAKKARRKGPGTALFVMWEDPFYYNPRGRGKKGSLWEKKEVVLQRKKGS